ncbi:hypothetical protein [Desulfolutivibrio sulfoxidireducens]|uniref:hypothetical protein n=1 Tax=Desulfolutivibrio sulfoxidireducens TaxID=2773299 RepID=UPI00159E1A19|nr:hypothetical protein [Desulfolutivibrio sulfoxidireducens]QLA17520.1 hypothetical protein GD605_16245 [Desulfolutivibrio sulfoxidireducens]
MRRLLTSAALALTLFTIGCAGTSPDYDTRMDTERDYLDCQNQSYVSTGTVTDPDLADERRQLIIDECMRHKGYDVHD